MQVWKIESRYFWRADPAESLDHHVEAAAAGGGDVGMWVRGAGGRGSAALQREDPSEEDDGVEIDKKQTRKEKSSSSSHTLSPWL